MPAESTPTKTFDNFLTGHIDDAPLEKGAVPEVGEAGVKLLKKRDPSITTKQQLMGEFMKLNCDKKLFTKLLIDAGLQDHRAAICADAFAKRAAIFCQSPGTAGPELVTAKGAYESASQNNFLTGLIRTDPLCPGMVPGIAAAGIKALKTGGYKKTQTITTSCQLMGYFIALGRDQNEFWEHVLEPAGILDASLKRADTQTLKCFEQKAAQFCTGVSKALTASKTPGLKTVVEDESGPKARDTSDGKQLEFSNEGSQGARRGHSMFFIVAIIVLFIAYFMRTN